MDEGMLLGPTGCVKPFKNEDDAIRMAIDSPKSPHFDWASSMGTRHGKR